MADYDSDKKLAAGSDKTDQVPTLEVGNWRPEDGTNVFGQRENEELKAGLLPRHMAMISVGGVIGTGLFLGTGAALHNGGPLGLWLAYCLMATVCFSMMMCLGEQISFLPLPGGQVKLAERFVGKPLSFTMGWMYVFNWLIIMPTELTAAAILVSFWTDANPGIFIAIFLVVVVAINFAGSRVYGEAEFWFASIKVLTIVALIIMSICLDLGAGDQGRLGFRYWKNPGPFAQYKGIGGSWGQFLGMFSVLIQAGFSFIGTEIVALAAGEARNPRRTLPAAVRKVWVRILFFYVLGTLCIGLIVPSNAAGLTTGSKTNRSPFVLAIRMAGVKGLPSVFNVCFITSAVSAASADLYTSSRSLYALAIAGNAPRILAKTNRQGVPYIALTVGVIFGFLAFLSLGSGASTVFGWFQNMTAVCGLSSWFFIALMYTRFHKGMKVQGMDRKTHLPFYNRLTPLCAWWTLFWTAVIIFFAAFDVFLKAEAPFDVTTFVTTYLPAWFAIALLVGSWIYYGRDSIIKPDQIDFVTGLKEIIDAEYEPAPPKNAWEKFWNWVS